MNIINSPGGVFYSPDMVQFSAREPKRKTDGSKDNTISYRKFLDRLDKTNNMEDYGKFLENLNNKVNDNTVPEFGIFPPIAVDMRLKDNSQLVFQIKTSDNDKQKKEFTTSFINAKTGGLISSVRFFGNKTKLLEYVDSIDEDALKKIITNCIADTE